MNNTSNQNMNRDQANKQPQSGSFNSSTQGTGQADTGDDKATPGASQGGPATERNESPNRDELRNNTQTGR